MTEITYKHFTGPKYEHDDKTGLSKFILSTKLENGAILTLNGLLSDLPEISFSINYTDGPGNEWQDILSKFMANDLVAIFNAIGAKGSQDETFKSLLKAGTWTKKVYSGYNPSTIPLKFRIYTEDTLGQTPASEWIKALRDYASISAKNTFDLKTAGTNLINIFKNAYGTGSDSAYMANQAAEISFNKKASTAIVGEDEAKQNEAEYKKMSLEISKKEARLRELFKSINAKNNNIEIKLEGRIRTAGVFWGDAKRVIYLSVVMYNVPDSPGGTIVKNPEEVGVSSIDKKNRTKDDIYLDIEKMKGIIRDAVETLSGSTLGGNQNDFDINKEIPTLMKNMDDIASGIDTGEKEKDFMTKLLDKGEEFSEKLETVLLGKYDHNRVVGDMNKSNALGEKLWYLYIYPDVIFNSADPLTVYISDWSYKPSDEVINNDPVYYDFEITCAPDQVYSRNTWKKYLANKNSYNQ